MRDEAKNIEILRLDHNYAEFILRNSTPAQANALRRVILSEIPALAIDEAVILENSSVLFDEMLVHRLAMIPLRVDPITYDYLRECYEEGRVDDTTLVFKLDVEASERPTVVYSGHLKLIRPREGPLASLPLEVEPVADNIPIVKLAPGQRIYLEAYARMGVGREHAKWQCVSVAAYKYLPRIRVIKSDCGEAGRKCAEACPKGVLKYENGKLIVTDPLRCDLCRACVEACPDIVSVEWDDTAFVFKVEGLGVLPVYKIIDVAFEILIKKLEAFGAAVDAAISGGKEEGGA